MATIEELLHRRTDLSTFLVHLTRDDEESGAKARQNLLDILEYNRIEARKVYGMAKNLIEQDPGQYRDLVKTQKVVSFTETPLEHAWMMCHKMDGRQRQMQFNGYGLAFTKAFGRRWGVNPVWYLDQTPGHGVPGGRKWLTRAIHELLEEAVDRGETYDAEESEIPPFLDEPIFRLTPFLEQMGGTKEFWWEREWRYVGDFVFQPKKLVVAFVPEAEQESFREDLAEVNPSYTDGKRKLPLVDCDWSLERMITAIAGVTEDVGPFTG
ncbi:abortive infection system antitoxin AbiGi family protein [Nocardiopsis sp. HUAS JQ3]|uniref:abortive infection system antitoxin AbiGi family protein n=1 Tax=Nocardiopsis sp. HUAS JQ3 TaxID=3061629 RepID=UPI0023A9C009|nr:abortive infection system antitoxin AbiGi family protein [Nocardiopsis sp. HUAS JQ3]WDZ91197.1 abortive infection system antitoxin AbiGi family protein [Nocardiopsis sp. HUAS JQ3]